MICHFSPGIVNRSVDLWSGTPTISNLSEGRLAIRRVSADERRFLLSLATTAACIDHCLARRYLSSGHIHYLPAFIARISSSDSGSGLSSY